MTEIILKTNEEGVKNTISISMEKDTMTWIELMSRFVDLLNASGYVIDKSRIEIQDKAGETFTLDEV